MSSTTVLLIAVPVLVLLALVVLLASVRRRDTGQALGALSRETRKRDRGRPAVEATDAVPATGKELERRAAIERHAPSADLEQAREQAPVPWVPPDPDALGVTRRQFFNRSIVAFFSLGLAGFGASVLAFVWPQLTGGFGSKIRVGKISDIQAKINDGNGFAYYPEGRMWITNYPKGALNKAKAVYSPSELAGMEAGVIALYQKCVHLGCRVPQCETSQWFECPCHGSQYNQVGEKKGGPAPRGLDRFSMIVEGGVLTVDTSSAGRILGPPIGTNTTGQEAEGPHCISGGE
jgi:cytochrome b6-f complex iron-sulfur subunit